MIKKGFIILLLILFAAGYSWCASGSIGGSITDSTAGNPLVGANVFL
ncbi:MAG TPA: hypothetical protein VMT35_07920 [Ignavibacteriaceae bacterium]|nr:hypothetical protein [Ignavibacteriaceae bacterium]